KYWPEATSREKPHRQANISLINYQPTIYSFQKFSLNRAVEMNRRGFLAATIGAVPIFPSAQAQSVRRKRIGYLAGGRQGAVGTGGTGEYTIDVLKASLSELGWRANDTVDIDERWADGIASRLPMLASELIALRPDVIACTGTSEAKA